MAREKREGKDRDALINGACSSNNCVVAKNKQFPSMNQAEVIREFKDLFKNVYDAALFYVKEYGLSVIPLRGFGKAEKIALTQLANKYGEGEVKKFLTMEDSAIKERIDENDYALINILKAVKRPAIKSWAPYQKQLPSESELEKWFKGKVRNIAVICGRISGNLVVIDFDCEKRFKEFIAKLKNASIGLQWAVENTWIVKTGKGYHVYLRLESESDLPGNKVRVSEGVDIRGEGGYVVAPPSKHPTGTQYVFILNDPRETPIAIIKSNEWSELINILGVHSYQQQQNIKIINITPPTNIMVKSLSDSQIIKIKELLKPGYKKGSRQYIWLFLSGWGAWGRFNPLSIAKALKILYDETGDTDPLSERLAAILYSYYKVWVKQFGGKWTQLYEEYKAKLLEQAKQWGGSRVTIPKSLERMEVAGKSGLLEVLENSLENEEKAAEIINAIEEIFKVASPYRDIITAIADYEKNLFYVANLKKLLIVRARRIAGELKYKERIAIGAPIKVTIYINPLGGLMKYEIVWETPPHIRTRPLIIGPCTIDDVIERLKAEGFILNQRLARDALSSLIVDAYPKKGRATIKEEIEAPGFYWVNGKIIAVRWELKNVTIEELREALILLNELATKWFNDVIDRFATMIKWWIVAPFNYIYKQTHRWIPWPYQFGPSNTRKSTINIIGAALWGLKLIEKPGSSIDTPARIGNVLSSSTFPTMIKEPGGLLIREDVLEIIKSAVDGLIARGKYIKGTYTEIPALSPLSFTSNKYLPRDDALINKRLWVLRYSYSERVDPRKDKDKIEKFRREIEPQFHKLKAIGYWIAKRLLDEPKLIELDWKELADKLLREIFEAAGLKPPEWIKLWYQEEENVYEDIREAIRTFLIKRINEEYTRFVGRVDIYATSGQPVGMTTKSEVDFEIRVKIIIENMLLPYATLKINSEGKEQVIFTRGLMEELKSRIGDMTLKSLAELLGWEYSTIWINNKARKGIKVK